MTDVKNALPSGYILNGYEVVRVLGFGSFGITYLAYDDVMDGPVAIKEYFPSNWATRTSDNQVVPLSEPVTAAFNRGLASMLNEAKTLAMFRHPNIVQVHKVFEDRGTCYIAMEYVEGEPLDYKLDVEGNIEENRLIVLYQSLLSGLEALHKTGLLHRDIKLGNIVIEASSERPVLIDFGAARQLMAKETDEVILTPGYAPPEQYDPSATLTPSVDLYALAATIYRCLEGNPIVPDSLKRLRHDGYIPAAEASPNHYDQKLTDAIDWSLAIEQYDRPQSAQDVLRCLKGKTERPLPQGRDVRDMNQAPETHDKDHNDRRHPTFFRPNRLQMALISIIILVAIAFVIA